MRKETPNRSTSAQANNLPNARHHLQCNSYNPEGMPVGMKAPNPDPELELPHVKQTQKGNVGCSLHKAEQSLRLSDSEALA